MTRRAKAMQALARRLRPERGAVLLLASLVTVSCLAATALAVDIGRGVALKRDLQADADIAAIDASRALGNKKNPVLHPDSQVYAEQLADESLERNGFDTDGVGNSVAVFLGVIDPDTRVFTVTDPSVASAVKVTLTTPIEWAFQPGGHVYTASGIGHAGAANGACEGECEPDGDPCVGACDPVTDGNQAGIALGSFLARVDTSGGLLKSVFGKQLNGNVSLVGYTGIAAGSVSLGELRAALAFGTVNSLLTTQVTVRNFLLAMVTVLQNRGDAPSIQAATDLNNLALAADPSLHMTLGNVITVASGAESAAAGAELNALVLAQAAAQLANGQNAVDITLTSQNMGGGLSGLLNLLGGNTLTLKVIEPLQIAFGPPGKNALGQWNTRVETAQVRAQINLRPLGTLLGGLLNLPIYVEAASADAGLATVTCRNPLDSSIVTVHTNAQALKASVGQVANINAAGSVTVNDATILDLLLTDVRSNATTNTINVAGSQSNPDLSFDGPFNWSNTQTVGSTTLGLGTLLRAKPIVVTLLGLNVGGLLTSVLNLLNPILSAVDNGLIDPLLSSLGVSLGGGDVTVFGIDCAAPSLGG